MHEYVTVGDLNLVLFQRITPLLFNEMYQMDIFNILLSHKPNILEIFSNSSKNSRKRGTRQWGKSNRVPKILNFYCQYIFLVRCFPHPCVRLDFIIFQAFIFGHMPPGFMEPSREVMPKCLMSDDSNARYLRMVENYADIISGQFFGHLHADTFRVFYNSTGQQTYTRARRIMIFEFSQLFTKLYEYLFEQESRSLMPLSHLQLHRKITITLVFDFTNLTTTRER